MFKNKAIILISGSTILIATILFILFLKPCKNRHHGKTVEINTVPPEFLFGFNLDTFSVDSGVIVKNENFGSIVSKYSDSAINIKVIEDSAKNVFSLRKIRHGNKYYVFKRNDSIPSAEYLIYEEDIVNYIQIKLKNPVSVKRLQKQSDTIIQSVSGIINNSLWADMNNAGASPLLINALSEIYEWDIDFFRIQKNDKFKVIYEEVRVEKKAVGIGKIVSAWFEHSESVYYAFYYLQDGQANYFDTAGKNLRKMFLKAPLKFSRISSGFSNSRYHPVLHRYRPHHGVDYAARKGTPVSAVGDGTVIFAAYMRGGGNTVKIRHNTTYTTAYLHLSRFGKGIRKGARVRQGDIIGYVGSTGLSTGPHLDYRIWKNGTPVNPLTLKFPPDKSISDSNKTHYNQLMQKLKKDLDKIAVQEKKD